MVDAHAHAWIAGGPEGAPELADEALALRELRDLKAAGGGAIVDCQPGGCGRDGRVLRRLMERSGVAIVASTGFHLRRYYRPGTGPWAAPDDAADRFARELLEALDEEPAARAGAIKCAWTGEDGTERALLAAAFEAARATDAALIVHTERGHAVERLTELVADAGVSPGRVQLSHVDKRFDPPLHRELAQAGFVLGYDSFLRPKYEPERRVWRLLRDLIERGLARSVTLGLDLVDARLWHVCGGPGLRTLPERVLPRLRAEGADGRTLRALAGETALRLLARRAR